MLHLILGLINFAADHFNVDCIPCVAALGVCKSVNFVVFRVNLEPERFNLLFQFVEQLLVFVFLVEVGHYQIFDGLDELFRVLFVLNF